MVWRLNQDDSLTCGNFGEFLKYGKHMVLNLQKIIIIIRTRENQNSVLEKVTVKVDSYGKFSRWETT